MIFFICHVLCQMRNFFVTFENSKVKTGQILISQLPKNENKAQVPQNQNPHHVLHFFMKCAGNKLILLPWPQFNRDFFMPANLTVQIISCNMLDKILKFLALNIKRYTRYFLVFPYSSCFVNSYPFFQLLNLSLFALYTRRWIWWSYTFYCQY